MTNEPIRVPDKKVNVKIPQDLRLAIRNPDKAEAHERIEVERQRNPWKAKTRREPALRQGRKRWTRRPIVPAAIISLPDRGLAPRESDCYRSL